MRYCSKCNKAFTDDKKYCNVCGSLLELPVVTDIFGDKMNEPNKEVNKSTITPSYYSTLKTKKNEIFTIVSFLLMFVPFYGTAFSILTIITNYKIYDETNEHKLEFILSIVSLVISIIWFALLCIFGVITANGINIENS